LSVVDDAGENEAGRTQAEGPRARERQGVSEDAAPADREQAPERADAPTLDEAAKRKRDAPPIDSRARPPRRRARHVAVAVLGAGAIAGAIAVWQLRSGRSDPACTGDDASWTGVWDDNVRAAVARAFAAPSAPFADTTTTTVTGLLDRYRAAWTATRADACRVRARGDEPEAAHDLHIACLDREREEARALTSALVASPNKMAISHAVDATTMLTPPARCADVTMRSDASPLDPAQRARRADLEARIARVSALRKLGQVDEALAPARAIVVEARTSGDTRVLAEALGVVGLIERTVEDPKAEATMQESVQRARESGDPELFANATVQLVEALTVGDAALNREGLGVARVAHAIVDGTGDPTLAVRLLLAEGLLQLQVQHRELALPLLQKASEKSRDLPPENEMLRLHVERELAWVLVVNFFHAEARAKYDAVIATSTRVLGALHPLTVGAKLDRCLASAGIDNAERVKSPACFEPAIADGDRVLGPNNNGMLAARAHYGATLAQIGKLDRAREVYSEALAHVPQDAWSEHLPVAADLARGLGNVELELRSYQAALDHCSIARDNSEKSGRRFPDDICIASALIGLGRASAALTMLEPTQATADGRPKEELGPWYFAYARAVWAVQHDAKRARSLGLRAKHNLSDDTEIDAWLAALPR
jgi:tetratricopeptide (TPR) repeat protein